LKKNAHSFMSLVKASYGSSIDLEKPKNLRGHLERKSSKMGRDLVVSNGQR